MDDDQIREFSEKIRCVSPRSRIATTSCWRPPVAWRGEGTPRRSSFDSRRRSAAETGTGSAEEPALIIGNIRDILADSRVVVKSSTGPDFIVNAADYIAKDNLVVGARVALNKQTLA